MLEIRKNELGFIDIFQTIYDLVSNYHPLLEKGMKKVILRKLEGVSREHRPFICISDSGCSTNSFGIRKQKMFFEVYAENLEKAEELKDILIHLFNRANFKGIRSSLAGDFGFSTDEKTGFARHILYFDFVFKDQNY